MNIVSPDAGIVGQVIKASSFSSLKNERFYKQLFSSQEPHFGRTGEREEHGVFVVLPALWEGKLCLIGSRRPAPFTPGLAFVGGGVDDPHVKIPWIPEEQQVTEPSESLIDTGVRELKEEVGISVSANECYGLASVGPIPNRPGGRPGTHTVHFVMSQAILTTSSLEKFQPNQEASERILIVDSEVDKETYLENGDRVVSLNQFIMECPFSTHREIARWFFATEGYKSGHSPFVFSPHLGEELGDYWESPIVKPQPFEPWRIPKAV